MLRMLELIKERRSIRSMVRHRIHVRYEIIYQSLMDIAEKLIEDGTADYFSYMLHAPGQGQYKRPGTFEAYVMKNQGLGKEEVKEIVDEVERLVAEIDWSRLRQLIASAKDKGIAVASHDDDSIDKVNQALELGASVVEFPLNVETARYAANRNAFVCVGAPNIVRGQSHDRNMRAIDAVKAGAANVICSDYYPPSMLLAVFRLVQEGANLPEAVNMAALHPARAVGIDRDFGSIETSKSADLLLVEDQDGYPDLRRTIVNGVTVYRSSHYFSR
jgi:alpha-D-ribose 1-methylphosphonate 5-triphosphate diphosphatase